MAKNRGSVGFFSTYRPGVPLDLYSCPPNPTSMKDEMVMTDGVSYNYNGRSVASATLKSVLKNNINGNLSLSLASEKIDEHVDAGKLMGTTFVSERCDGLEELHFAAVFSGYGKKEVQIWKMSDILPMKNGIRMEDSGAFAFAGKYYIYISTHEPALKRRQPWTAVYRINLSSGLMDRMTPRDTADLSPTVSPSGKWVAVASFQDKRDAKGNVVGWDGEIEDLKTDIYLMSVENPSTRKLMIKNGGWPTWGSDNVLFFHRAVDQATTGYNPNNKWRVHRAEMLYRNSLLPFTVLDDVAVKNISQVTPDDFNCMTPSAIDETRVVVATIRKTSTFSDKDRTVDQYRHIEIFNSTKPNTSIKVTQKINPLADFYTPFVIDGGKRIGYQRCKHDGLKEDVLVFDKLRSPKNDLGIFRVGGVFPNFTKNGSKLTYVDNEFKSIYVVDSADWNTRRAIYTGTMEVFAPVWSQNPNKDIIYFCTGPAFSPKEELDIYSIHNASTDSPSPPIRLTNVAGTNISNNAFPCTSPDRTYHLGLLNISNISNNAFPCTSPDGKRMVYRSTDDQIDPTVSSKNLFIMENADTMEIGQRKVMRVSEGAWTDTHCQWSPKGDWIVFSSTRDKPRDAPLLDNGLDAGYFAVYLMSVADTSVVVRVMASGYDLAGHVNHPFFSPDGASLVVSADLAAVSVDPMSLTLFMHSVRPYGDMFTVDLDTSDILKNKDIKDFKRITHSRYENSTVTWASYTLPPKIQKITMRAKQPSSLHYHPLCPYLRPNGGESWNMTGHIIIPNRKC